MEPKLRTSILNMPSAIIIAGAIVAIAIIWTHRPQNNAVATNGSSYQNQLASVAMAPVSASDHILGNPNSQVKIVEYSDPSCPFCKAFNPVMVRIMDHYGPTGKVAWVYRSFPLDKPDENGDILHPNAGHESQALECAASLGGNTAFWKYEEKIYDITPSVTQDTPSGLDQSQLPIIAAGIGLDQAKFNSCLSSGQMKSVVESQFQDGLNAGVVGTPTSFIVTPSANTIPLPGVRDYNTLSATIDALLSSNH